MPVTVKRIKLWLREINNRPGALAATLSPLADAGADLHIVMGYRYHGTNHGAVEVYPMNGRKATNAARQAGFTVSPVPTLLIEGDNKPGIGRDIAQAVAEAAVNLDFVVAQVIGKKYSAIIGFENDGDAQKAAALIKKVAKSNAGKKAARRARR